jgi:hypothetical protein
LGVGSVDARQQLGEDSSAIADKVVAFVIEHLMEWGVSRIYGYPGNGINGITAALCKGGDEDCPRRAAPAA